MDLLPSVLLALCLDQSCALVGSTLSLCLDQSWAAPAGTVASKFLESDKNRLAQNVVSRADVQEAAIDLEKSRINHHFSTSLKEINGVEGLATSQKASGRCWLFAMLNTLRYPIIQQLDLSPDFELSQSHLFYWDKVERANFFLETIIETADEPFDGRLVQWLLSQPVSDGGQWDMCVNLILKHGVMPQECFPETFSSSASARMNYILTNSERQTLLTFFARLADASCCGLAQSSASSPPSFATCTPPAPRSRTCARPRPG